MNIGPVIREVLEDKGVSITKLAVQLSFSRTNIYKMFDRNTIDTNTLFRLCKVVDFDFFALLSDEFNKEQNETKNNGTSES